MVKRYAVMGTGSAGHALAALISAKGYEVNCYDTDAEKMDALNKKGSIDSVNKLVGNFPVRLATADPALAIEGADIIMFAACSNDHGEIAKRIAPFVKPDQIIVLNPGATCGALEIRNVLKENGCAALPVIAEAQDVMCTSRSYAPGTVDITGIKNKIALATIPAPAAPSVCEALSGFFPSYEPKKNILYTSLGNIAIGGHPAFIVMNVTRIEEPGDYYFFREGYTPSCGRIEQAIDDERLAIARAFGIDLISSKQWLLETYGIDGKDITEAKKSTPAYYNVKGPSSVNSRYVFEDLPTGMVPMSQLGKLCGVPTPIIDATIAYLSVMTGIDYREKGRTLKALGLEGMSVSDIIALVS